jgi:hypothetical protein
VEFSALVWQEMSMWKTKESIHGAMPSMLDGITSLPTSKRVFGNYFSCVECQRRINPDSVMGSALRVSNPNTWAATVQEVHLLHDELNGLAVKSVGLAARIGEILVHVKGAVKHGEWLPWLDEFAPFSRSSAERYIWIFENKSKFVRLTNLSEAYQLKLQSNGDGEHKPQQLHESNFYFHSIKLTQRLMGDINHEIKDHPLETWQGDKIQSLAAALEPAALLYDKLKSMLE